MKRHISLTLPFLLGFIMNTGCLEYRKTEPQIELELKGKITLEDFVDIKQKEIETELKDIAKIGINDLDGLSFKLYQKPEKFMVECYKIEKIENGYELILSVSPDSILGPYGNIINPGLKIFHKMKLDKNKNVLEIKLLYGTLKR
ncbi:MAG: hypothetical protein ACPLXC_03135 [Candidatus Pacearchaeota archaeon]